MRLFLNPESSAYLRGLAEEFNESTNSVRLELNRFEEAGMLHSDKDGNKKIFKANVNFPLFKEIQSILLRYTGIQDVLDNVISQLGDIHQVYLTGDLAEGRQTDKINITIVGHPDVDFLQEMVKKAEKLVAKKIQYTLTSKEEMSLQKWDGRHQLLIWHEESI